MTISSTVNKVAYTANGTNKSFFVPFYFIYKSDLKVYRMIGDVQELLTLDTDYTIAGTPEQPNGSIYREGGTVVMNVMPTAGTRILVLREVPMSQETDYQEGSTFPATLHELALDKLTMEIQQLAEKTERAVTVDLFSDSNPSKIIGEIEALYNVKEHVVTAAENIDAIVVAANDIEAIKDAPAQATAAIESAKSALASAVESEKHAQTALISASGAKESADIAVVSAKTATDAAKQAVYKNIGDIFYTSRLDTELNGAVEADGSLYSVAAFTGAQSVTALLADGKLPFVSMKDFEYITNFAAKTGEYVNGVVSDRTFNATAAGGYFKPISYPVLGTSWSVTAMLTVDTTKGTADKPIISGLNSSDCKAPLLLHDNSGNLYIYASSNGTSWNMAQRVNIGTVSNGETYAFTLSSYLKTVDGVETPYLRVILSTVVDGLIRRREQVWEAAGQAITNNFPVFGCHSYANNPTNYWNAGTFHLTTFYLQGCEIWVDNEKIWYDPLFQDKPAQPCRAFGYDGGDTFRVPKLNDVYLMAGQAETAGEFIGESLPNITGSLDGIVASNSSGAFTLTSVYNGCFEDNANIQRSAIFNASNVSSAYQDGAKVRPDSVRYRAMVQIATGVTEDATQLKEYKFNNPFYFGFSVYSEAAPNNASWLLSNGAFHKGGDYSGFYQWLLKICIGTKAVDGVSVKGVSDEYTDFDFVINSADGTFRLPLIASRVLVAKKEATTDDPTWFNWYSDGWLEQGGIIATTTAGQYTGNLVRPFISTSYHVNIQQNIYVNAAQANNAIVTKTTDNFILQSGVAGAVNFDWQAKGYAEVPTQSDYTELKGLYFYVGNTLQDPDLINAGQVLSDIADLKAHTIVETYRNGTEWYRLYSDGWCEQGGFVPVQPARNDYHPVTLLKPYLDTDYWLIATKPIVTTVSTPYYTHSFFVHNKTQTGFTTAIDNNVACYWEAKGYIR